VDIPLGPEPITHLGSLPITNSLLMSWLVISTLLILALLIRSQLKMRPGRLQNAVEFIMETLYGLVESVAGTRAKHFFPVVATFFFFILFSNWFGLIPGLNAIGINEHHHGVTTFVPLFRSVAADLNTTLALALISVVLTQYYGIRFKGIYGYVQHYFHNPLQGGIGLILLGVLIGAFVGALELVSEFVKVISLSFRLFGNIYAGEVVISTISGLLSYIAPVPFLLLETIVGAIQAIVFALLSLVFFSIISQPVQNDSH